MSIHDLPHEILLHIWDQVSRQDSDDVQGGHYKLLRVCRHWNKLFFNRAWKSVHVRDNPGQIIRLLTALQENHKIGPLIQHLKLEFSDWKEKYRKEGDSISPEIDRFKPLVEKTSHSLEHSENWINALRKGITDAWVALLVPSLEGVKSLQLHFSSDSDYFLPTIARAAAEKNPFDSKPVFQNLENVVIKREDDGKTPYDMANLLPFFYFPAMQSFDGHAIIEMSGVGYYEQYPQLSHSSFGLKKLDLGSQGECNGPHGFADVMKLCKGLEIFEYQHDDHFIWGDYDIAFVPRAFYTSLYTQKHSLREIRLNHRGEHPWSYQEDDSEKYLVGPFGSMAEFHQLRELQIPWGSLLQADENENPTVCLSDVLPRSLEYLCLADCREKDFQMVVDNLQGLLQFRHTRCPNLKLLQVQTYTLKRIPGAKFNHLNAWEVPQPTMKAFASVEAACREMGIQYRISNEMVEYYR